MRSLAAGFVAPVLLLPAIGRATDFTIPEGKLLDSGFASPAFGPAIIIARVDAPGPGVVFTFSGLDVSATGVKDDYPVDTVYGQNLPSHGNGDFSGFAGCRLRAENQDSEAVWFSLFMNTGFTGPSGSPPNNPANDTFWQSAWSEVLPGETTVLRLDFDNAIAWNIADNPPPHTQGAEGEATRINDYDRTEVSAIGFQVAVLSSNPDAAVLIGPAIVGDLNGDCVVDYTDFTIFSNAWLTCTGNPSYNPACDLDGTGCVDMTDFTIFSNGYLVPCP